MKSYQYLSSVDFFYVLLNIHVRDRGALVIAARIFASFHKLLPILAPLLSIGGFPIARGNRYSKTCGVLLRRAPSQAYQSCGISSCCYRYYFLFFLFVWFSFVLFFFFFFFFLDTPLLCLFLTIGSSSSSNPKKALFDDIVRVLLILVFSLLNKEMYCLQFMCLEVTGSVSLLISLQAVLSLSHFLLFLCHHPFGKKG